jgi:3-deoxy-D-manno-octulosonic-acid transferase
VPRHAERREEIKKILNQNDITYHIRSEGNADAVVDIAVADTTGELRRLTQLADIVFVGKSLLQHTQGQTPVEAAALCKPIVTGPGTSNFKSIINELKAEQGVIQIQKSEALYGVIKELLQNPEKRTNLSDSAFRWYNRNGGAVDRTLQIIKNQLV